MKKIIFLLTAMLLGGCATHWPEIAYINPQIIPSNQQYYSGNSVTLEGVDRREAAYVFSVKKKDQAAILVGTDRPLATILSDKLSEGLRSQGLNVGNIGSTHVQLEVLQAAVTVEEKTFTYVTRAKVSLKITADYQGNKVSKQFNASSSKEGPGQPDMAELESILNQHLGNLLQQMMSDQQVRAYIKGQAS